MNYEFFNLLPQRVGWTLVHSIWQFSLVALLLLIVLYLLRNRSSATRYIAQCIALASMVLLTLATFAYLQVAPQNKIANSVTSFDSEPARVGLHGQANQPSFQQLPRELPAESIAANLEPLPSPQLPNPQTESWRQRWQRSVSPAIEPWLREIFIGWLLGILLLSVRPIIGWRTAINLRCSGTTAGKSELVDTVKRLSQRLGVAKIVHIVESSLVEVPTVIGWLQPLILLPASSLTGLSREQLEAVLAHELAHVRRHDYLVNAIQVLFETIFFYHPAVWWVSHRMRIERENCCDDIAIAMTGDRTGYARLLVWLDEIRGQVASPPVLSSTGGSLMKRVRRIVCPPARQSIYGGVFVAALLSITIMTTGVWLMAQGNESNANSSNAAVAKNSEAEQTNVPESDDVLEKLPPWMQPLYRNGPLATLNDQDQVVGVVSNGIGDDDFFRQLATLPQLRELNLESTSAVTTDGLAQLAKMSHLEKLTLYNINAQGTALGDDVIGYLAGLTNLRELLIIECGTTDNGAKLLEELAQLTSLTLRQEGQLTDAALKSIGKLTNVTSLSLNSYVATDRYGKMEFSADGLRYLLELKKLQELDLIGHDVPADLIEFPELTSLSLGAQSIGDDVATKVANLRKLRQLELTYCGISDDGLKAIATLPQLRRLNISSHKITDAGIAHLRDTRHLEQINIRASDVTDATLKHLAEIDSLTEIVLYGSGDAGVAPGDNFSIAGLQQLRTLPNLRNLWLNNLEIPGGGYSGLQELSQLQGLTFFMCNVTTPELEALEDAMPDTFISHMTGGMSFIPKRLREISQSMNESQDAMSQSKSDDAKKLYGYWQQSARSDGAIPGGLIGQLAAMVDQFTKSEFEANEKDKLPAIRATMDAKRDWSPAEAVKLLNDIGDIHTAPLGWASMRFRMAAFRQVQSGQPLPESLADAAWGEPTDSGLRAAWVLNFEDGNAETNRSAFPLGAVLTARVLLHNAGDADVLLATETFHQGDRWTVVNSDGKPVEVETIWYTGMTPSLTCRLAPGHYVEVLGHGVAIGAGKYAEEMSLGKVGAIINANVGDQLSASWEVQTHDPVAGGWATTNADGNRIEDPKYYIRQRVMREAPLPASPADRKLLLEHVYQDLLCAKPDETDIEWFDGQTDDALEALVQRLSERPAPKTHTGSIPTGQLKFSVTEADPTARFKPRTATGPGRFVLSARVHLLVSRTNSGDSYTNRATVAFLSADPKFASPHEPYSIELPDGLGGFAFCWVEDSKLLYLVRHDRSELVQFSFDDPDNVERKIFERESKEVPAEIRKELNRSVPLAAKVSFDGVSFAIKSALGQRPEQQVEIKADGSTTYHIEQRVARGNIQQHPEARLTSRLSTEKMFKLEQLLAKTDWLRAAGGSGPPSHTDADELTITLTRDGKSTTLISLGTRPEPYASLLSLLRAIAEQEYLVYAIDWLPGSDAERQSALYRIRSECQTLEGDLPNRTLPELQIDYARLLPTFRRLLRNPNTGEEEMLTAIALVTNVRAESEIEWIARLKHDREPRIRAAVAESLTAFGGERVLPTLVEMAPTTEEARWGLVRFGEIAVPDIVKLIAPGSTATDHVSEDMVRVYLNHRSQLPGKIDRRIVDAAQRALTQTKQRYERTEYYTEFLSMAESDGQNEQQLLQEAAPIEVELKLSRQEFLLGESISIEYVMTNTSNVNAAYGKGGYFPDLRINDGFRMSAIKVDENGKPIGNAVAALPMPDQYGGKAGGFELKPSEKDSATLFVTRYLRFLEAGRYRLRIENIDRLDADGRPYSAGETHVTLKQPSPKQARRVFEQMKQASQQAYDDNAMKFLPGVADFQAMIQPIYLPILREHALQGDLDALESLQGIKSLEANQIIVTAMQRALERDDWKFARGCFHHLKSCLPFPNWYNEPLNEYDQANRDRVARTWKNDFAPTLIRLAQRLNIEVAARIKDRQTQPLDADANNPAFMKVFQYGRFPEDHPQSLLIDIDFIYRCLGQADDFADCLTAFEYSIELTKSLPLETNQYFRPRGSASSFHHTVMYMLKRGAEAPKMPNHPGEAAAFAIAIRMQPNYRPNWWQIEWLRWLKQGPPYLSELMLDYLPDPMPAGVIDYLPTALSSDYIDLQIAACKIAEQYPLATFRKPLQKILEAAKDEHLLRFATQAAQANGVDLGSVPK